MLISSRAGNVSTLPRSMIILYIILVMKFVLRKAREKTKNEYDEPATSFFDHFTMWYPRKFAPTKCIPVQPRTYDELQLKGIQFCLLANQPAILFNKVLLWRAFNATSALSQQRGQKDWTGQKV